jgi:hypothetical protein
MPSFREGRNIYGQRVWLGSDGMEFAEEKNIYGETVLRGSNGVTFTQGSNVFGQTVWRGSNGVDFTRRAGLFGPVLDGSDGSTLSIARDLTGARVISGSGAERSSQTRIHDRPTRTDGGITPRAIPDYSLNPKVARDIYGVPGSGPWVEQTMVGVMILFFLALVVALFAMIGGRGSATLGGLVVLASYLGSAVYVGINSAIRGKLHHPSGAWGTSWQIAVWLLPVIAAVAAWAIGANAGVGLIAGSLVFDALVLLMCRQAEGDLEMKESLG